MLMPTFYHTQNFEDLMLMYDWLSKKCKATEERLALTLEENARLQDILKTEKNRSTFID